MDSLTKHFLQNGGQDESIQYDNAQWDIFRINDDDRAECTLSPDTAYVVLNPSMTIDGVEGFWQAYEYTESDMSDFRLEADRQFEYTCNVCDSDENKVADHPTLDGLRICPPCFEEEKRDRINAIILPALKRAMSSPQETLDRMNTAKEKERQIAKEHEFQNDCDHLVRNEVIYCQSGLVDDLLQSGKFSYEDIENIYDPIDESDLIYSWPDEYAAYTTDDDGNESFHEYLDNVECLSHDDLYYVQEILEWWIVTAWLAHKLNNHYAPLLQSEYGDWYWGRCTSGQAVNMDHVIREITKETRARA